MTNWFPAFAPIDGAHRLLFRDGRVAGCGCGKRVRPWRSADAVVKHYKYAARGLRVPL